MNDIQNHPDLEQLLLLVDESAPTRANRWVRRHVAACWKCRSHLEELQETVRDLARYHEKVLLPNLPPPPQPWPDLHSRMRQMDEANPMSDLWTRTARYFALPSVLSLKRLTIVGLAFACVALAVTLAFRAGERPSPAINRTPVSAPSVNEPSVSTPAPPVPAHAPRTVPTVPSPVDTEVRIFAALHRIGADLGDPIEISSDSKGNLQVIGVGLAPERQAEVRSAVASLPDVSVAFPLPATAAGDATSRALHFVAGKSPFEEALQKFLGGQAAWESYANEVLDESDAVLTRAHALQTLADHFPAARRATLGQTEKTMLDEIADAHRTSFGQHVRNLESLIAPIRDALHAPSLQAAQVRSPLPAAEAMDRVLSVIFGVASTNLTAAQLLAELSQASSELQGALK
jgi:hypothetical protein